MMPNSWQYRLFILSKEGVLTYYDTEVPDNKDIFESKERGRIDLKQVKFDLTTDPNEGAPTAHTLIIQPEDSEKWKLCADTKEDHSRWWKSIEKFALERVERSTAASLAVQSDDDVESSPLASRGMRRVSQRPSELDTVKSGPIIGSLSTESFASPKSLGSQKVSALAFPGNSPLPTPVATLQAAAPVKRARGLKLQKDSGFVSQDWMEWGLIMVIVNICLFGALRSGSSLAERLFYLAALNVVVGHSLYLRAYRLTNASTSTTTGTPAAGSAGGETAGAAAQGVPTAPSTATGSSPEKRPSVVGAAAVPRPSLVGNAAGPIISEQSVSAGRSLMMTQGKKPVAGTQSNCYCHVAISLCFHFLSHC